MVARAGPQFIIFLVGIAIMSGFAPLAMAGTPKLGDSFKDCDDCPEMVIVPPGSFLMGDLHGAGYFSEKSIRAVRIGYVFAVGKFEVTFDQWAACVSDSGCNGYRPDDLGWGRRDRPVVHVSWQDAKTYVMWLSRRTGETYRLLSEAEWEYAARATSRTKFPWGNSIGSGFANCDGCGSLWDDDLTAPVGSFAPNPSVFTICMATSTNGSKIAGTPITSARRAMGALGRVVGFARFEFCAGVLTTIRRYSFDLQIGTAISLMTATTCSVDFALPGHCRADPANRLEHPANVNSYPID